MNLSDIKRLVYRRQLKEFDQPLTQDEVGFLIDAHWEEFLRCFDPDSVDYLLENGVRMEPKDEGKLLVRGIGTFKVRVRPARPYRVREKLVKVKDRSTVCFIPGTHLAHAVRKNDPK